MTYSLGPFNTTQGPWVRPEECDVRLLEEQPASKPTKKAHVKMLRKYGKLNTFVKCPGCKQRGGLYYMHHPEQDNTRRWCYFCGWMEANHGEE